MLAYPDVQILDVMGPLEVFSRTSRWLKDQGLRTDDAYSVEILGLTRGALRASSGLRVHADHRFDEAGPGIDTLLIAGGLGTRECLSQRRLLRWIRTQSRSVRRLASICTGAFLLAEAGLLDGLRATTHWDSCADFAGRFPRVRLEPDTLYVREGRIYTSAGVTSGMDLALAMVEEDLGRDVALAVARQLVLFLRRSGGQAQFSAQLSAQLAEHEPLRDLQTWILEHTRHDLSADALARRAGMSPRHFARVFTREVGQTPARYVTAVRVETARRLLEETTQPLEAICDATGFGTIESMRRAFLRNVGVAPGQYRQRFARPEAVSRNRRRPH
jgi:transcriptional regulator GlxA family with amidase domain